MGGSSFAWQGIDGVFASGADLVKTGEFGWNAGAVSDTAITDDGYMQKSLPGWNAGLPDLLGLLDNDLGKVPVLGGSKTGNADALAVWVFGANGVANPDAAHLAH